MSSTRECKSELGYTRSSSKSSKTFLDSLQSTRSIISSTIKQDSVSDELQIFIDKLEQNRKNAIQILTRQKASINLETKKQCSKNHTLTSKIENSSKFSTHVHLPSIFKPWKPSFPKLKYRHGLYVKK
jgi:hypothetical protein